MKPEQATELAALGTALQGLTSALPCEKNSFKAMDAIGNCIKRIHSIVSQESIDPDYEPNRD